MRISSTFSVFQILFLLAIGLISSKLMFEDVTALSVPPGLVWQCNDLCPYAGDGSCDDGGPNSKTAFCPYGSDCTDCGIRDPRTQQPTMPWPTTSKTPSHSPIVRSQSRSQAPASIPSQQPTNTVTRPPSTTPTSRPVHNTKQPTNFPTLRPTASPTLKPSGSSAGTLFPSKRPTKLRLRRG